MISICLFIALLAAGSIGFQVDSQRDFIIAELIHSHSYMSPASRVTSLDRITNFSSPRHDIVARDAESEITFNKGGNYIMKINVGGQNLLLVVTTGSASTWMLCERCDDCYEQEPLFLPNSADGYEKFLFQSKECQRFLQNDKKIRRNDMCWYNFSYRKMVSISAILSRATSSFESSTESKFPLYFGCVHEVDSGKLDGRAQGMVSLSHGDYSLITQLGKEFKIAKIFTYCLLPYGSTASYSKIIFGNKATISTKKVTIPFNTKDGLPYYYLTLSRVVVINVFHIGMPGDERVRRDNIKIDPGTMMTTLPSETYEDLVEQVKKIVDSDGMHHEDLKLCFDDTHRITDVTITLMFYEADITLTYNHIFLEIWKDGSKIYCMMIEPAEEGSFPVLGAHVQQGFAVEYNLEDDEVSFAKADCYSFGRAR